MCNLLVHPPLLITQLVFDQICHYVRRSLCWTFGLMALALYGFLVEREMVMKILAWQDTYFVLVEYLLLLRNATFNHTSNLIHFFTSVGPFIASVGPIGYYFRFQARWRAYYDTSPPVDPDPWIHVAPRHPGYCFQGSFMMDVSVYNQLRGKKSRTRYIPWE